ncbi:MAG: hypothetical protein COA32_10345 [Fluviicola sp.]|nr:MAG: hypothetical protein COA32_10345 [Fluviicola sp.]
MKTAKKILSITIYSYLALLVIWSFLYFTPLEITNKLLKQIIYETVFFGVFPFTIIFAIRIWLNRNLKNLVKFISSICIIISPFLIHEALPGFGIVSVFWHSRSVWEDLEVIAYKSEGDKILKQRIDSGALGYDKRIVREIKITSYLSWSIDYFRKDLKQLEKEDWIIKSNQNLIIGG